MEQTDNRKPRWLPLTSTATTVACMSFSAAGDKELGASLANSAGVPALYGPVVTLCTASLTLTNTTFCPHSCIYVLCGSENKQRLFHCTASTGWFFITETERVYCAVRSTFYVLPTQYVYVFCVDLRTNSDYFTVQH